MLITFGSHRKLDPGRRCPRQPHIEFKEGRSYAVTNPWWRRMPPRRIGGRNARGGASDANGAERVTEAERRAQELGAAMLNAARPYIDVTLDRQGYPLAIQPRDFFTFMEAHAAFNNRTPNVTEKALVVGGDEHSRQGLLSIFQRSQERDGQVRSGLLLGRSLGP